MAEQNDPKDSAADDDPSGIATYSQVGTAFGYGMLWCMLLTMPLKLPKAADSALYAAKGSGENQVRWAEEDAAMEVSSQPPVSDKPAITLSIAG